MKLLWKRGFLLLSIEQSCVPQKGKILQLLMTFGFGGEHTNFFAVFIPFTPGE